MSAFRPKLPPRRGYIEVEDSDGNRVYQKIGVDPIDSVSNEVDALKSAIGLKDAQIQAMTDRNDFIEECLAEMATLLYQ